MALKVVVALAVLYYFPLWAVLVAGVVLAAVRMWANKRHQVRARAGKEQESTSKRERGSATANNMLCRINWRRNYDLCGRSCGGSLAVTSLPRTKCVHQKTTAPVAI